MSEERHIELVWRCSTCRHQTLGRSMVCGGCGKPKDESEEYEMPANTEAAASVEDEKLLDMAKAGAHWRCTYCGSHQRALDGGCARCGAGRPAGAAAPSIDRSERVRAVPFWKRDIVRYVVTGLVGLAGLVALFAILKAPSRKRPTPELASTSIAIPLPSRTDFPATVKSATWTRTVVVEQWKLLPHEGFTSDVPADALAIVAAGVRFHHNEDVFDHDETVYDDVEVPDGTKTETYSTREACGEDCTGGNRSCRQVCTQKPQRCHEECTNKKNGFASCHQVCSGGGQDCREQCTGSEKRCTTRYCDRSKSRQVAKTRFEKRARVVKKFRQEPRTAPWSTYKTWEWATVGNSEASGTNADLHWPDAGAVTDAGVGVDAGAMRETRKESFQVDLVYEDNEVRTYYPKTAEELASFTPGAIVQTRVHGRGVTIL